MQKELIAEIHRTASWSVVVTVDGNIRKPNKADVIDRNGSYINTRLEYQEFECRNYWALCRPNLIHKNLEI